MTASLLIVGRGRMGRLVEALAPDYEFSVAGTVDVDNVGQPESWPKADVAIDFSLAEAVPENFPRARRARDEHRHWRDRLAGAGTTPPRRGGGARHRGCRRAELRALV